MQGGPIAALPLKGARSQIIWSDQRRAIQALMQLNDAEFLQLLTARLGDYLGALNLKSPRQSYPLHLALSSSLTAQRLALIGDAAHIIHPLAGQGLNLAFRDIAALSHCLGRDFRRGQDIGLSSLQDYSRWRGADTRLMAGASHGFNLGFGLKNPLAAQIRRMGMHWVNNAALLKSSFMSEAAGNLGDLPELMRI